MESRFARYLGRYMRLRRTRPNCLEEIVLILVGNETLKKQRGFSYPASETVLHRLRCAMQNRDHKGRFAQALVVRTMPVKSKLA